MLIDALSVLCAQLTRDLLAIAKFLLILYLNASRTICLCSLPTAQREPITELQHVVVEDENLSFQTMTSVLLWRFL